MADIIETVDGLYDGQRVRLSSAEVSKCGTRIPMEACGKLELEDIYTENFLLCHAFIGGNMDLHLLAWKNCIELNE